MRQRRAQSLVSGTHLAQRFKEVVGIMPERLARTYRFAATVLSIDPAGPVDWLELAAGAGYYDQRTSSTSSGRSRV